MVSWIVGIHCFETAHRVCCSPWPSVVPAGSCCLRHWLILLCMYCVTVSWSGCVTCSHDPGVQAALLTPSARQRQTCQHMTGCTLVSHCLTMARPDVGLGIMIIRMHGTMCCLTKCGCPFAGGLFGAGGRQCRVQSDRAGTQSSRSLATVAGQN